MKKAFSIIALCMAIIFCIPAVPAFASNDTGYFVILPDSYNLYSGDIADSVKNVYYSSSTFDDSKKNNLDVLETSLLNEFGTNFIVFNGRGYAGSNINRVVKTTDFEGVCYIGDNFTHYFTIFLLVADSAFTVQQYDCSFNSDGSITVNQTYNLFESALVEYNGESKYMFAFKNSSGWLASSSSPSITVTQGSTAGNTALSGVSGQMTLRYCPFPLYTVFEDSSITNNYQGKSFKDLVPSIFTFDYQTLINNPVNVLTNNGIDNDFDSGIGVDVPSFSDTTYNGGIAFNYQQTHLYTQYNNAQGANETCVFKWALDERSRSITQTTSDWLMHYYVIVYWHWTQATDSSVYTPLLSGGSGGSMAFEFDAEPDFIMQGQTEISIWDLVQHVPTISSVSDEDIVSLAVAVSCLNGNIVNSVWRDIFGQSGQYVGDVASEIISGGKLEVQGVGEFGGSFINNLFNPAYYYALDDLRIKLVAHPWSGTKNIHGGNGDFDLNLRSNDSYGTTQGYVDDGGTPEDPSDDTQYPSNTVPQQNNVVVPVTYPTSGGNVTVYSVVQVPDSGGGGGNSINYSPTFSPSIVMDSGLDDLKETVDAYPQVPNQHFWDYFLVFKDNAFLDATSDFFGALPNELSSLLISSIGIIGVFAIYRFVRRR